MNRSLALNRGKRTVGFLAGILLFYAPFAFLVKGFGLLAPASMAGTAVSDVHTACLRMPWQWLAQPWMLPTMQANPIYFLPILALPALAIAFSPLFCGWMCPAGALPESMSRLVPDRFKFDLKNHVSIIPLRYGFFLGFLLAPFVSSSICCSFCNFTHMQNLVSASFGDTSGLALFTTMGVAAAALWIVPLGLFAKGGRGWCMLLCPAGTMMGLASSLTARKPWARRIRASEACISCGQCERICPMRAVESHAGEPATVDQHLCNGCMDCVSACKSDSMRYGRPQ